MDKIAIINKKGNVQSLHQSPYVMIRKYDPDSLDALNELKRYNRLTNGESGRKKGMKMKEKMKMKDIKADFTVEELEDRLESMVFNPYASSMENVMNGACTGVTSGCGGCGSYGGHMTYSEDFE